MLDMINFHSSPIRYSTVISLRDEPEDEEEDDDETNDDEDVEDENGDDGYSE